MSPRVILVAVAVVAACVLASDIGPDPARALCRVVPALRLEMARHIVDDDDATFRAYCAAVGTLPLRHARENFHLALEQERFEDYRRVSAIVLPSFERLASGLEAVFEDSGAGRDARFRRSLDPARGYALHQALAEVRSMGGRPSLGPGAVVERGRRLCERFEAMGYERGVLTAEHAMVIPYLMLGDLEQSSRVGRTTLERARRLGERTLTCQILGELGYRHLVNGDVDSMRICYGEAYRLALRYRLPEQAGRLLEFESNRHVREGRLALATEFAVRAQRVCRELRGGGWEARFVLAAIRRFAELGCWDAAEQELVRCPALLRQLEDAPDVADKLGDVVDLYRARALAARGEIDSARAIYRALREPFHRVYGGAYFDLLHGWSLSLLEAGAGQEALPAIDEAIAHCDTINSFEVVPDLAMMRVEALLQMRRHGEAESALEYCDSLATRTHITEPMRFAMSRDVLAARLATERNHESADVAIGRAWRQLLSYAHGLDAGPQAYLALEERRDLRLVLHERHGMTAEDGYRLEMDWRALPAELGRAAGAATTSLASPRAAARASAGLPGAGEMHVVYFTLPEFTLRWTATPHGVTRDTLWLPLARCEADQRRLAALLNTSSRSSADARELTEALRAMANRLLPAGASLASTLYVSADGPLCALPFEALNVAPPGRYRPLALATDVATVRGGFRAASRRAAGGDVVVADPVVAPELSRRYPSLRPRTGSREMEIVERHWPKARSLSGTRATKRNVLHAFGTASRIHVAAHVGRVPEAPFLTFVPLALPPSGEESESMLEVKDIRSLDLSGCDRVILSACGSGAPYVSRGRVAPSLGDAFLDAGARAVIHTLRDITDDEAVAFTDRLLPALEGNRSTVAAVNACRRDAIGVVERENDPTAWATWSVSLRTAPWANGARPDDASTNRVPAIRSPRLASR